MIRTTVLTIGENRNKPRIWIEGKYLEKAGFMRDTEISVNWKENSIEISKGAGESKVSGRKEIPIIEIHTEKIKTVFDVKQKIRVLIDVGKILITKTKIALKRSQRLRNKTKASIFAGGGLLDKAGDDYETKFAIEINQKYADVWQANHNGTMHNCDVAQIPLEELEQVELLLAGIPCEPFAISRRNDDKEFHENADLSMFFLMMVEKINPRNIVLEEVPAYLKSDIGKATIQALNRMGYDTKCKIIAGTEYGEITTRRRAVIVASTDNYEFPKEFTTERKLGDILHDPEDSRCEWFTRETKSWLFEHWEKQKAKGNNFPSQILDANSTSIQAIKKRYFAQQGDNPVVKHPTKEGLYRWLTIPEVKRIMGLPDDYYLGDTKTYAGEIMGQGVLVNVFKKIIGELKN